MDFFGKYNIFVKKISLTNKKRLPIVVYSNIRLVPQGCCHPNTTITGSHSIIYGVSYGHVKKEDFL